MKKNLLLKAALMLLFPFASAISPLDSATPFTMPLSASGLPDGEDPEFETDVPPDCAEIELDSIVVLASRVGAKSPTAFTQLDRVELQALRPSASL